MSDPLALAALAGAVRGIGRELGADRCWLYARDPARGEGIALVRWLRADRVPDVPAELHAWTSETADLAQTDPLFGRALAGAAADAVDDSRAAGVNPALEDALGHRAFVHLNLHREGQLVGVLQPGMTGAPRTWTETGALVALAPALAALTAAAVGESRPASRLLVG